MPLLFVIHKVNQCINKFFTLVQKHPSKFNILLHFITTKQVRGLDKYKLHPDLMWQDAGGMKRMVLEALEYCAPLMLLDTFMTKKYTGTGLDPMEWRVRRANWVQHTRALPPLPPSVLQIVVHLLLAFIIYDVLFFAVHFAVHKNLKLYRWLHHVHHDHDAMHSRITNQLSVPERIILVLAANEALRIVDAHPLTRFIFVPLFMGWLVENHCGYDLPCTLDKVVPLGLVGGSPAHYTHHAHGARNYQPFFTYIDKYLNKSTQVNEKAA